MILKISKLMKFYKDQAILINGGKDLFYLTGATFGDFWLLLYKKAIFVVVHEMIEPQVNQHFKKYKNQIKIFPTGGKVSDKLTEVLKKYKIMSLLVDSSSLSLDEFDIIKTKLSKVKIKVKKQDSITHNLRVIKDKTEIRNIQKACDIASKVLESVRRKIYPGMTELDIHFKIEEEFAKQHVVQSFKTIVASGPNSAKPHHISGNRKIKQNDIVLIDMGCVYNGYCSDITRTFFVGKQTSFQRKIWDVVKCAHDTALKKVKQNMKACDIDSFARNVIKQAGYEKNFIHTTGHSLGLDIHEKPRISKICTDKLKEGMIITIEPGIYLENKFGVRIEDTVLVTKNGYKVLTTAKY